MKMARQGAKNAKPKAGNTESQKLDVELWPVARPVRYPKNARTVTARAARRRRAHVRGNQNGPGPVELSQAELEAIETLEFGPPAPRKKKVAAKRCKIPRDELGRFTRLRKSSRQGAKNAKK
jgi:hypothetical protein